ncbi:MAG: Dna2/Cas4 domain-containing protein [Deltaproteobacteria bacterium]|nr:Dna2/Cas4 domain-containing protein [Deltaproteobacteria bacterium]
MVTKNNTSFSSSDLATYIVCPEAWRLKKICNTPTFQTTQAREVKVLRKQWFRDQETSSQLRFYAKIILGLLALIVVIVFFLDEGLTSIVGEEGSLAQRLSGNVLSQTAKYLGWSEGLGLPLEILGLLLIVGVAIFIWDLFDRKSSSLAKKTGMDKSTKMVAMQESEYLPSRSFSSRELHLTSTPDALLEEDGILIPVDIKPRAKKVRDRHIIEMVAHLRLIEEETKKTPTYGMLLLGEEKRQVKIKNTPDRQRQLEVLLEEMLSISEGTPALPRPTYYKCQNCDVRHLCSHSAA